MERLREAYGNTENSYVNDSLAIWLPIGNDTLLIPVKTADEYKEADLKLFDNPAYKSYGSETDIHYYGQELRFDGKDASLSFIVEPQIFYAVRVPERWMYEGLKASAIPKKRPELYVIVVVQFESGGKTFSYSRTYLPKVSEVKYDEAVTIVSDIKTRFNAQTDKTYKDEYKASLDKKMEFLKTE